MKWLVALAAGCVALTALAVEPLEFANPAEEARFHELTSELRCVVCQNQSLADSDAPLAHDLRREVYDMLRAGRSDEEIKRFLTERYGQFVLYRPPLSGGTLLLWLAPGLLLAVGVLVVAFNVSRRTALLDETGNHDPEAGA